MRLQAFLWLQGLVISPHNDAPTPSTGHTKGTDILMPRIRNAQQLHDAVAQYITRTLRFGGYEIQFNTKAGSENRIDSFAEPIGRVLEFYTRQYGLPAGGQKLVVCQTDDDTLDTYSGSGIIFLASKLFDSSRPVPEDKLQREVAYQWWGQTVGLKSFDDAWLSQGLAEWSAFTYREANLKAGTLDSAQREEQEARQHGGRRSSA